MNNKHNNKHENSGASHGNGAPKENADNDILGSNVILSAAEYDALKKKADERDEAYDKMLKALADFDNFRKRNEKDKGEYIKFDNEGLILELVGILDNFERGIKYAEQKKDFDLMHQGVGMIIKQLYGLLS